MVVVGRTPNTDAIGLEAIGLKTDRGTIPVGDYYQTAVPGVYAIGDVVAEPWLAHVAFQAGGDRRRAHGRPPARQPRVDPTSSPASSTASRRWPPSASARRRRRSGG